MTHVKYDKLSSKESEKKVKVKKQRDSSSEDDGSDFITTYVASQMKIHVFPIKEQLEKRTV